MNWTRECGMTIVDLAQQQLTKSLPDERLHFFIPQVSNKICFDKNPISF